MARRGHRDRGLTTEPQTSQNRHIDTNDLDEQSVRGLIDQLKAIADREAEPGNLRKIAREGAQVLSEMLDARVAGDQAAVEEIWLGTLGADDKRANDGFMQVLPRWARGTEVLDALRGIVVADESRVPPTVTVHWERVPPKLRPEAASLASELVDMYYGRPRGGRPRKKSEPETG